VFTFFKRAAGTYLKADRKESSTGNRILVLTKHVSLMLEQESDFYETGINLKNLCQSNFILVMDFTEQLLSPLFLRSNKDRRKKNAGGFAAGRTCRIVACAFSVMMFVYNHKIFDCQ